MPDARFISLFGVGVLAGSMLAVQSVINAALGKRVGVFGTALILATIGFIVVFGFIALFPSTANLRKLPGLSEWYYYLGAFMGIAIMLTPIYLIPKIGATSTLTALVTGQLFLALMIDHFGLFATPKIEATIVRVVGVCLVVLGAYMISR